MPLTDADYADLKRRLAQDTVSVAVLHVKGDADALHVIARASFRQGGSIGSGGVGGGPTGWTAATLLNSWVAFSPTGYTAFQYRRDTFGFVHIRGAVKNGGLGSTIVTLPAGFRPGSTEAPLFASGNGAQAGNIFTTGVVVPPQAAGNSFVGLFYTFLAEN